MPRLFILLFTLFLAACGGSTPNGNDSDKDGVANSADAFPNDPTESKDTDGDGIGDNADTDDDGDNVPDSEDAFPRDATESLDTDGDGVGNNADTDDDGDGVLDADDTFPLDSTESVDTDGDEIGDNADTDDDGDSVLDTDDAFPLDESESLDTDGDGVGNNEDTDDDGDGAADIDDVEPLNSAITGTIIPASTLADNQAWLTSQSPYLLTGDVALTIGSVLSIEPGVEVRGESYSLTINGTLSAVGTAESPILFNDLFVQGGENTFEQPFDITVSFATITQGSIFWLGGDTEGVDAGFQGSGDFLLSHSLLHNTDLLEFNDPEGSMLVDQNVFLSAAGIRASTFGDDNVVISNNVFIDQSTTYAVFNKVAEDTSAVTVTGNSFLSTEKVALRVSSDDTELPGNIVAASNYFNTIDPEAIALMISDRVAADLLDEETPAFITYTPYLYMPSSTVAPTLGISLIADADGDGSPDIADAFVDDASESIDSDLDGIGNNTDTDDDGDTVLDVDDTFPLDASESVDTDSDGTGNNADTDDDGDTVLDVDDAFPLDASESVDTDSDGTGNNADTDDDNDTVLDVDDAFPLDASESVDTDSDGTGNNADNDDDGDGVLDENDAFPLDESESLDTDLDGIGNNADTDDDNDGVVDINDDLPLDESETVDTDNDGIGNNADNDDDNDGVLDADDTDPLDPGITPPTAVLGVDQDAGLAPFLVSFSAGESVGGNPSNPSDVIVSTTWASGDGTSWSGDVFEHIYLNTGTFTASLTVVNSSGLSNVKTQSIVVSAAPADNIVEGVITLPNSHFVDSDVNNTDSTPVNNGPGTGGTLQFIPSPSAVSGYVNLAGSGEEGNSYILGDLADDYTFQASAGDVINLTVGNAVEGDIDLYLFEATTGMFADSSQGTNTYESVTVPETGVYILSVVPFTGASTYTLELGGASPFATHGLHASADINPGVLIATKSPAGRASKASSSSLSLKGMRSLATKTSPLYSGPLSYVLDDDFDASVSAVRSAIQNRSSAFSTIIRGPKTDLERKANTLSAAKTVQGWPEFTSAEPSINYRSFSQPNDPLYQKQWHFEKINLPSAWDISGGAGNVKVAVLDTGIHHAHPDLAARISSDSYDFVSNINSSGDGDGIDANPSDPGTGSDNVLCLDSSSQFSSFHGTHVAGTVGAVGNNDTGVAGVNWNVELMDVRVLGCGGSGSVQDIVDGIYYAAGLPNRWGLEASSPADIINLSLGSQTYSQSMATAVLAAREAGVIVVAASGNNALDGNAVNYPAANDGVISVAATNRDDVRADYSTSNAAVDLAAPGGHGDNQSGSPDKRVYSTSANIDGGDITSTYSYQSGTSMAAPHVAGVASLMKEIYPLMTPAEFESSIIAGYLSVDLGESGKDIEFGYGRVDANKALSTAVNLATGQEVVFPAQIAVSTNLVNLGFSANSSSFEAFNAGDGSISVISVESTSAAVSVFSPTSTDGLGRYGISISRANLAPGAYSEFISVVTNAGAAGVFVRFEVLPAGEIVEEDAGVMYTLLYNINTSSVEHSTSSLVSEGAYTFSMTDVAPGVYILVSGTDIDNDGFICGNGETCAVWPNTAEPDHLIVNQSYEGLDLSAFFVATTGSSGLGSSVQPKSRSIEPTSCSTTPILGSCSRSMFKRGDDHVE